MHTPRFEIVCWTCNAVAAAVQCIAQWIVCVCYSHVPSSFIHTENNMMKMITEAFNTNKQNRNTHTHMFYRNWTLVYRRVCCIWISIWEKLSCDLHACSESANTMYKSFAQCTNDGFHWIRTTWWYSSVALYCNITVRAWIIYVEFRMKILIRNILST